MKTIVVTPNVIVSDSEHRMIEVECNGDWLGWWRTEREVEIAVFAAQRVLELSGHTVQVIHAK